MFLVRADDHAAALPAAVKPAPSLQYKCIDNGFSQYVYIDHSRGNTNILTPFCSEQHAEGNHYAPGTLYRYLGLAEQKFKRAWQLRLYP